jgi:hypothetical protein
MMKGVVAAAAAVWAWAPAYAESVVFESSGALSVLHSDEYVELDDIGEAGPGTYLVSLRMLAPGDYQPRGTIAYHVDYTFYCDGQACGGNDARYETVLQSVSNTLLRAKVVLTAPYSVGDGHFRTSYSFGRFSWVDFGAYFPNPDPEPPYGPEIPFRLTIAKVPEPATWAMMIGGLAMIGIALRRRSKRPRMV